MASKDTPEPGKKPIKDSTVNPSIENKPAPAHPSMYEVWLLNDDYTPVDFVVFVLEKVFHKQKEEANSLALQTHENGQVSCGAFTREVAETKVMQVIDFARENDYPLKCIMRKSHEYVVKKS